MSRWGLRWGVLWGGRWGSVITTEDAYLEDFITVEAVSRFVAVPAVDRFVKVAR